LDTLHTAPFPLATDPAPAAPAAPTPEQRLEEAMSAKLQEMAAAPLSPKSLGHLERVARSFHETLVTLRRPNALPANQRRAPMLTNVAQQFPNPGYPGDDTDEDGSGMMPGVMTTSSQAETFATKLAREVIGYAADYAASQRELAMAARAPTAAQVVIAIAEAKEAGLDDIVTELREGLHTMLAGAASVRASLPHGGNALPAGALTEMTPAAESVP
jgi:hypothetical protein